MDICFNRRPFRADLPRAVTIGNFDGVHLGHKHILQTLRTEAQARRLQTAVVIFEPQPPEFFARRLGTPDPLRLTPLRDKLRLLKQSGCVDAVRVLRFNAEFAAQCAPDFIRQTLCGDMNTRYLLVGDDFRFGKGRGGDFALLRQCTDFVTEQTPSVLVAGGRASSTAVRHALQQGRLDMAQQILGRPYALSGRVKHGAKLGRTLGCPTANIHLPTHRYALNGVFVIEASGSFGTRYGVASFGTNPTVSDTPSAKLEVHLFDFQGNLYGQRLEVSFLHKLRDETRFSSLNALQAQIQADMDAARNWAGTR